MAAENISQLLTDWTGGDEAAVDKLFPAVYNELRRLASKYMRHERPGHTLQTTALVHEAYVRLVKGQDTPWTNRIHFFAIAARVMRQILVDHARTRHYAKREGSAVRLSIDDVALISEERSDDLVALDEALKELAILDERQSKIVELRYFGGLTIEETAQFLKVSTGTVRSDWRLAKAWLSRQLK
jgi:RNA polymerase sigma-70 factor (ECF subfamily)